MGSLVQPADLFNTGSRASGIDLSGYQMASERRLDDSHCRRSYLRGVVGNFGVYRCESIKSVLAGRVGGAGRGIISARGPAPATIALGGLETAEKMVSSQFILSTRYRITAIGYYRLLGLLGTHCPRSCR